MKKKIAIIAASVLLPLFMFIMAAAVLVTALTNFAGTDKEEVHDIVDDDHQVLLLDFVVNGAKISDNSFEYYEDITWPESAQREIKKLRSRSAREEKKDEAESAESLTANEADEFFDTGSLRLVANKVHPLPISYEPRDLTYPHVDCVGSAERMREEASEALEKMFNGAKDDGVRLRLGSGYRSEAEQVDVYNGWVSSHGSVEEADKVSSRPGYSDHQTGLAADIADGDNMSTYLNTEMEDTPGGIWLREHAHEYGFIMRYPKDKKSITGYEYEPWHFRYVGVEDATAIYNKGEFYSFEEYFDVKGGEEYCDRQYTISESEKQRLAVATAVYYLWYVDTEHSFFEDTKQNVVGDILDIDNYKAYLECFTDEDFCSPDPACWQKLEEKFGIALKANDSELHDTYEYVSDMLPDTATQVYLLAKAGTAEGIVGELFEEENYGENYSVPNDAGTDVWDRIWDDEYDENGNRNFTVYLHDPDGWKQCTDFAHWRFWAVYGIDWSGAGNGCECADNVCATFPDASKTTPNGYYFEPSDMPSGGSIYSVQPNHGQSIGSAGHVGFVEKVEDDYVWFSEGNYISHGVRINYKMTVDDFITSQCSYVGGCTFAVPVDSGRSGDR